MAGFKALKQVCIKFDEELKRMNEELFSAKPLRSYEDVLAKKLDDLKIYSTKYHILRAKEAAETFDVFFRIHTQGNIIDDYTDTVQNQIIERAVVKSLTQSQILQGFLTTSDQMLEPAMVTRKSKIILALKEFGNQESVHRKSTSLLQKKQDQYHEVRARWGELLPEIAAIRASVKDVVEEESPLYSKLKLWSDKMEMIRWLFGRLLVARPWQYDWQADPEGRVSLLALTRRRCDVESFLENDDDDS